MNIVFAGTPAFALPILENLTKQDGFNISAVITQPDRPAGRGNKLTPPPVKELADELDLRVEQPNDAAEFEGILEKLKPDFLIVVAYGIILPKSTLQIPRIAAINIHASLLPKYRGAAPIQAALLNDDAETGIAIQRIAPKLDTGDIYLLQRVAIAPEDHFESLIQKLAMVSSEVLPTTLLDIQDGLRAVPQSTNNISYCGKIKKTDGQIDFTKHGATDILNMIRAYSPWPGVYTDFKGKKLKIFEAEAGNAQTPVGEIEVLEGVMSIGTKQGSILPKKVQLEGKQATDIESFVRGI